MASERISRLNKVEIEGYLKANTLERRVTSTGKEAIMGLLTIAISANEDHRIRYMATEFKNNNDANPMYSSLEKILPENTTTIATLLTSNPNATFDEVKEQATKVAAWGSIDVYDRKSEGGEITTMLTLRGMSAAVKKDDSKKPFAPRAKFDVEAYVDNIKDEKKDGEETGRVIVVLSIPDDYKQEAFTYDFICESDSAKGCIVQHEKGGTARYVGAIRNTKEEKLIKGEVTEFMDGTEDDSSRTVFTFVNEYVIEKMTRPYSEDDTKALSAETIRAYKTKREKALEEMEVTPDKRSGGGGRSEGFMSAPAPKVKGFEL